MRTIIYELLPKTTHIYFAEEFTIFSKNAVRGVKVLVHHQTELARHNGSIAPRNEAAGSPSRGSQKHHEVGQEVRDPGIWITRRNPRFFDWSLRGQHC